MARVPPPVGSFWRLRRFPSFRVKVIEVVRGKGKVKLASADPELVLGAYPIDLFFERYEPEGSHVLDFRQVKDEV